MAGTLKLKIEMIHENDGYAQSVKSKTVTMTQTTQGGQSGIQLVGTVAEALALGDVAAAGSIYVLNVDGAAVIQVGVDASGTFKPFTSLAPGQHAALPGDATATYQVKSSVANGKLFASILPA